MLLSLLIRYIKPPWISYISNFIGSKHKQDRCLANEAREIWFLLACLFLLQWSLSYNSMTLFWMQVKRFKPALVAVRNESLLSELKEALADLDYKPEIIPGEQGVIEVSALFLKVLIVVWSFYLYSSTGCSPPRRCNCCHRNSRLRRTKGIYYIYIYTHYIVSSSEHMSMNVRRW